MTRLVSVCVLALVACGTEPIPPGTLALTVDDVPPFAAATGLIVRGTVTRTPTEPDLALAVTVALGSTTVTDTAGSDGAFSASITLPSNAATTVTISASDASGSTSTPTVIVVAHDGVPPTLTAMTPADLADMVNPDALTVQFSEPITPQANSIVVSENGVGVPGTSTLSSDSLSLTFTPAASFAPNAIHAVTVGGIRDRAGNLGGGGSRCFTTGGAQGRFDDAVGTDVFATDPPPAPGTVPTDMASVRLHATPTHLLGIVAFTTARSLDGTDPANTLVALDLDTDQDSSTGFLTYKDAQFAGVLPSSRMGSEYLIIVFPQENPTDSALVVQWTDTLAGNIVHRFAPSICGTTIGVKVPLAALGGDDGAVHGVVYADVADAALNLFADAAPDSGYMVLVPAGAAPGVPNRTGPPRALEPLSREDIRRILGRRQRGFD